MKNLFQTIINLLLYLHYILGGIFFVIYYGKLPKVSIYHTQTRNWYNLKEQFEDVNCQVKVVSDVPEHIKSRIIDDYITDLYLDDRFKANIMSLNIPIFDGKEVIGSGSVADIFTNVKEKNN